MFKRLTDERVTVSLPKTFNMSSMRQFIRDAIHMQAVTGAKRIVFDFSQMSFIEPEGVVVLANTDGSADMATVIGNIRQVVAESKLPPGFFTSLEGVLVLIHLLD